MELAQYGTNDIDNYGDLLYPVVWNEIFKGISSENSVQAFGFLEGEAPCGSLFDVRPIRELLNGEVETIRNLLVGGGDILRTDNDRMAGHYINLIRRDRENLSISEKILGRKFSLSKFKKSKFPLSCSGPFLLNSDSYDNLDRILYASCGIPFHFESRNFEEIRKCFDSASFVYLRDDLSVEKLMETGFSGEVSIAPDVIVLLSRYFPKEEVRSKGIKILSDNGVTKEKKLICFQSVIKKGDEITSILNSLDRIHKKHDVEIILLPIGFCHNDALFLKKIEVMSEGKFKYINAPTIYDIMSVISSSDLFVGTSMHGNITAFSYGVPFLFAPLKVDKIGGLLKGLDLDDDFRLKDWEELIEKFNGPSNTSSRFLEEKLLRASGEVDRVLKLMFNALRN